MSANVYFAKKYIIEILINKNIMFTSDIDQDFTLCFINIKKYKNTDNNNIIIM